MSLTISLWNAAMSVASILLIALCGQMPAEDLQCLKPREGEPPANQLFAASLRQQASAALDRRQATYDGLKSAEQITAHQQSLKSTMLELLGGMPERTPLNARIIGKMPGDGCHIEKFIFESQPRHHLTATLYLPKGQPPFPAVLVSSGHSRPGKAAEYNQRFGVMLARHGMAALCYDPIGQGERSQILSADGKPQFSGTTMEHSLMGVGSILVGANTARYRIWDGMRVIDYVSSRPDIDATRIGFTGCSGGGTLTSYVMALDDRVACAAPSCYLTTFRRLLETIGPQDAEQNIFAQLTAGIDQPDYVLMRAPRPTLISSTTNDFFDIAGTWDNFRQSKRIFERLGYPERVDLVEAEGRHGVQPGNLIGITRWMRRWLLNKDDAVSLEPIRTLSEADLQCTERGQVLLLPGERSVFDLNAEIEDRLAGERKTFWAQTSKDAALDEVRKLAKVRRLADLKPPKMVEAGRVDRESYHIDKLVLHTDSGVPLPGLTYHPKEPQRDAYLYLHESGKAADGGPGGPIESLIKQNYVVVALDLRGIGETAAGRPDALLGDAKNFFSSYLLGQSLVGLHAEDVLAGGQFVSHYRTSNPRKVHLIGVGRAAIACLHAAALEPDLFASVSLRGMPESWSAVVGQPVPSGLLTTSVHGALRKYDLPDLVRALGPDKLRIEQ